MLYSSVLNPMKDNLLYQVNDNRSIHKDTLCCPQVEVTHFSSFIKSILLRLKEITFQQLFHQR